jgi:hypothetical protein
MAYTRIYKIWKGIKRRCLNPHEARYKDYGGRGIKICESWKSFENFYKDNIAQYNDSLTIDRINPDGDYEPGNVQWITKEENSKRNNITGMVNQYEVYTEPYLRYRYIASWTSIPEAGRVLKVDPANIYRCCATGKPYCAGYFWQYADKKITDIIRKTTEDYIIPNVQPKQKN